MPKSSFARKNLAATDLAQPVSAPAPGKSPVWPKAFVNGGLQGDPQHCGLDGENLDLNQADCAGHTALLKRAASARMCESNTAAMTRTTWRPASVAVTTRPSTQTSPSSTNGCNSESSSANSMSGAVTSRSALNAHIRLSMVRAR